MPAETPSTLLAMRVSEVLKLHDGALAVLIEHGFTPLAQTHLRSLLAPTVTLAQAIRLKSLSPEREKAMLDALGALIAVPERRQGSSSGTADAQAEAATCR